MSSESKDLRSRVLALLRAPNYQPLDKVGLSKSHDVHHSERKKLRDVLDALEQHGDVARIRKDRYILPDAANLITGKLEFHRNGSAHLLSETPGTPDVFIAPNNTGTAMHGDRVVVQHVHEGRAHRSARPGQVEGRVVRILSRFSTRVVGTLQQSPRDLLHVIPDDPRFPHTVYVQPGGSALDRPPRVGDKVVVELAPWENRFESPEGEITEV